MAQNLGDVVTITDFYAENGIARGSVNGTTDNQLIITDGDWTATPSTVGNVTTYTLAKATLQKPKFRLLYTVG